MNDLPDGWKWVSLEEIQHSQGRAIVSGPFGSNIGRKFFVDFGVPVIRGNNLSLGAEAYIDNGYVFVTEQKAEELSSCQAVPGDIIFTAAGSIGQVGLIPENARFPKYIISNKQIRVRLDEAIADRNFVYYWLSSSEMVANIQQQNTGSSVPLINLSIVRALPVPLPPLEEQRAIADILGSLDDKIEANRHMNETLEAIARAIFKSWFVDFDPVHTKASGETPTGMDAETAALFPDSFEDSEELGPIPLGWRVGMLGDVADVNLRSIKNDYRFDVIEYIDISSVTEGRLDGTSSYALDEAPSRAKRIVRHGDIIWSTVRPNRKSYFYIHTPPENAIASTGFAVLSAREIPSSYLYSWVTTDAFVEYLVNNAIGSAYPAVNASRFADAEVLLPSPHVLCLFDEIVAPMRDQIAHNERESRTLAETRDALLPKLVSGELRVGEIVKEV